MLRNFSLFICFKVIIFAYLIVWKINKNEKQLDVAGIDIAVVNKIIET